MHFPSDKKEAIVDVGPLVDALEEELEKEESPVRRLPEMLAEDIVGVQPMSTKSEEIFNAKFAGDKEVDAAAEEYRVKCEWIRGGKGDSPENWCKIPAKMVHCLGLPTEVENLLYRAVSKENGTVYLHDDITFLAGSAGVAVLDKDTGRVLYYYTRVRS